MSKSVAPKKEENVKPTSQFKEEFLEEDLKKKAELELLVDSLQDPNETIVNNALNIMANEIRTSTSSMTAVPKPLKFLRPHLTKMDEILHNMSAGENKELLADILSVLNMVVENTTRDTLRYKLMGSAGGSTLWGHEYLRHLAGEIAQEYDARVTSGDSIERLMHLVDEIIPYNIKHHAEPEACDLLLEVECLDKLTQFVDANNFERIALYLIACSQYLTSPEDAHILRVVVQIYLKVERYSSALQIALRLSDAELVAQIFDAVKSDFVMRCQLAFMIAQHHAFHLISLEGQEEKLQMCLNNENLSNYFKDLLKDLQITEPKEPDDIYKSHLSEGRTTSKMESARQNMATSFVSGFVNAASGTDKLLTINNSQWLSKTKEFSLLSTVASLGLIYLWDYNVGLSKIDSYLYSEDDYVKSGALIAIGVMVSGVRSEFDPAMAMLTECLRNSNSVVSTSAAIGLGIAYAGSNRADAIAVIRSAFEQPNLSMETLGYFSLSLGLIALGTADPKLTQLMVEIFTKDAKELESSFTQLVTIGLGLLYLGKRDQIESVTNNVIEKAGITGPYIALVIETMSYANSSNPVDVQRLLQKCSTHEENDLELQGVAVIGIGILAMNEEIGTEMASRTFEHLLRYGESSVRRAVPLALSLTCLGNPNITVIDTLSKLSHDHDTTVAMGAILALGLVGVGTNNSRIAQLLRQLASYYYKDQGLIFVVRISQGLLHLGKGTMSLRPTHLHALCTNQAALGALISFVYCCLDFQGSILGRAPHLLYLLSVAIHPRMLMTLDENLEPVPVPVRVGTAVDLVGQAGKPKTITGFQTHTSPVLLAHTDRAELASNQWIALTDILEGFVIVKPNPEVKLDKLKPKQITV